MADIKAIARGNEISFNLIQNVPAERISLQLLLRLLEAIKRSQIAPVILIGGKSKYTFALSGEAQVAVDDGEHSFFAHHWQQTRRDDMDTGEGQRLGFAGSTKDLLIALNLPPAELKLFVEEQVTRSFTLLHRQRGKA